ncbi:MAG TPA: hypothetical protein VJ208_00030 [Candidatus Nanoarchaeia archaeon]|nr:hypothetical protein [Candidatus Nanoarchaeia archaeon]
MVEKETVFSSKIRYNGFFSFSDFYNFCHSWLTEETGLDIAETKYSEKLSGETKNIEVKWAGFKKLTDYFKFETEINFKIDGLAKVEVNQGGIKVQTNKGSVEIKIKGVLARDYQGKFETTAFKKFLRSIYEKWVIPARIEEYQGKVAGDCDEFLNQAKAYLDLEGKK